MLPKCVRTGGNVRRLGSDRGSNRCTSDENLVPLREQAKQVYNWRRFCSQKGDSGLKEVRLVDREAVQFLARCETEGVELDNCPAYIREWIEKERTQLK